MHAVRVDNLEAGQFQTFSFDVYFSGFVDQMVVSFERERDYVILWIIGNPEER